MIRRSEGGSEDGKGEKEEKVEQNREQIEKMGKKMKWKNRRKIWSEEKVRTTIINWRKEMKRTRSKRKKKK